MSAKSYTEMVQKGANETELRRYLSEGDQVAVTLRIPHNLKASSADEASLQGMSFSAFVRNCLLNELTAKKDI